MHSKLFQSIQPGPTAGRARETTEHIWASRAPVAVAGQDAVPAPERVQYHDQCRHPFHVVTRLGEDQHLAGLQRVGGLADAAAVDAVVQLCLVQVAVCAQRDPREALLEVLGLDVVEGD